MLTQTLLRERLHYNPDSGVFTSKTRNIGRPVGSISADGYRRIDLFRKKYQAHRLAYLYVEGQLPPDDMDVDHINGDRLDNRWVNLRLMPSSVNRGNLRERQLPLLESAK